MKKPAPALRVSKCVLLLVLSTGLASASTVRGRLLHINGYPAAGVAVTVSNQQAGRSSPAYAGPDGMYYLYNVPPGYYYLAGCGKMTARPRGLSRFRDFCD